MQEDKKISEIINRINKYYQAGKYSQAICIAEELLKNGHQQQVPSSSQPLIYYQVGCHLEEQRIQSGRRLLQRRLKLHKGKIEFLEVLLLLIHFNRGLKQLNNFAKNIGAHSEEICQGLHDTHTCYGLMLLDEYDSVVDSLESSSHQQSAYHILALSRKNLYKSLSISKLKLKSKYWTPALKLAIKQLQKQKVQWRQNFCQDMLNLCTVHIVEASAYAPHHNDILQRIIIIVDITEKYYEICPSPKSPLKVLLSRCYYHKGLAYRLLKNYKKAEYYLQKDLHFCSSDKVHAEDEKKTRQELFNLYIENKDFDKALKLGIQTATIQDEIIKYKQIIRRLEAFQCTTANLDQYQELAEAALDWNAQEILVKVNSRCAKTVPNNKGYLCKIYYYSAFAYLRMKRYKECRDCLDLCKKLCTPRTKEFVMVRIIELDLLADQGNMTEKQIIGEYQSCLRMAQTLNNMELMSSVQGSIEDYKSDCLKRKVVASQQMPQLFNSEQFLARIRSSHLDSSEDEQYSNNRNIIPNKKTTVPNARSIEVQDHPKTNAPRAKGPNSYLEFCKTNSLTPNLYIAEQLAKSPHTLQGLIDLPSKHIEGAILAMMDQIVKIDINYITVTDSFFDALILQITSGKLNLAGLQSFALNKNKISYPDKLLGFFRYCTSLQQLSIKNVSQFKLDSTINVQRLTNLTIKACDITDAALKLLRLELYSSLQYLNLSKNKLTVSSFAQINKLGTHSSNFRELRLSANPLLNGFNAKQNDIFTPPLNIKLHTLVLKKINYSSAEKTVQVEKLLPALKTCRVLNISDCKNIKILLESIQGSYLASNMTDRFQLQNLIIRKSFIRDSDPQINSLLYIARNTLRTIDLSCVYDCHEELLNIVKFALRECHGLELLDLRGSEIEGSSLPDIASILFS